MARRLEVTRGIGDFGGKFLDATNLFKKKHEICVHTQNRVA
jgi:hypothetical protein